MEVDKIITRVADEVLFGINGTDGIERVEVIISGLKMMYGAGFDEGRKSVQRHNHKEVIQLNLVGQPIKLWNSIGEACHNTGIDRSSISKSARGELQSAGGFIWKYPKS